MKRRNVIGLFGLAGAAGLLGFPQLDNMLVEKITKDSPDKIKDKRSMKTIGILGGFGPQATMDLESKIHLAAQRLIPHNHNTGYPPMVVFYYRDAPVLLKEDFTPVFPLQPASQLLEFAKRLGKLVDFILMPSNGVHMMKKQIEEAAGCRILSIIDVTMEEVLRKKWKRVGVLGYKGPMAYTERLKEVQLGFETIGEKMQGMLDESIMRVMEGSDTEADRKLAMEAIDFLRRKNVDGIIPGCTEIPLLLGKNIVAQDLVNPAELLANEAVRISYSGMEA